MKKFYVTTSIAYANAPPHLGFALELIQADVIARYHQILGEEVFFLTGTDEHGLKIARAAEKAGKAPEEFTNELSSKFKELRNILNLSNNDFIRTTDKKRHWPNAEKIWEELKEKKDIYKKKYRGLYCVGCEAFIKGKDLVDGKCPAHQTEPELIEEENYFFKLSKYGDQVKKEIETDKIKIVPEVRKNEILSFIKQGVEDISCSRSKENLKWGIPVPGDQSQVIYIWFEALINYLFPKKYWPADVHFVGKDIFRFHALLWPAILIAVGLERPKNILVHGFITSGGKKMSKSLGNVIDPFGLVKKYGTDAVRYFLLREIPPTEDGDFTYQKFEGRYNSDLASGIGNLVSRVITMAAKSNSKFQILKEPVRAAGRREGWSPKQISNPKFKTITNKTWKNYRKALNEFKFNEALISIWELISFCDKYIEKERPWEESKKQKEVIDNLLFAINNIAEMLQPFLPETSEKIFKNIRQLAEKTKKAKPLFPRI